MSLAMRWKNPQNESIFKRLIQEKQHILATINQRKKVIEDCHKQIESLKQATKDTDHLLLMIKKEDAATLYTPGGGIVLAK